MRKILGHRWAVVRMRDGTESIANVCGDSIEAKEMQHEWERFPLPGETFRIAPVEIVEEG